VQNDTLEKQLTGAPVFVTIAGRQHRLQYKFAAIIAYQEQTGDSLFAKASYASLDVTKDPKRWLACLWAGLHEQQADKKWKAPYTLDELAGLIDLEAETAGELSVAVATALAAHMTKAKDTGAKKDQAPAEIPEPAPA
jgi:hypothetical protein